jgi:hypothetical protein
VDEAVWLACTDPDPVLRSLRGQVSERKLRRFACAGIRRSRHRRTCAGVFLPGGAQPPWGTAGFPAGPFPTPSGWKAGRTRLGLLPVREGCRPWHRLVGASPSPRTGRTLPAVRAG